MPDHQDETSHLFGNQNLPVPEWRINLELLKVLGFSCPLVGLILGFVVSLTKVFTSFNLGPIHIVCDTCPKDIEKTYIVKLFGFAHTCVMIDFNPGKPFVAIIFIVGMFLLTLFTILDQARLKRRYADGETCLKNVVIFSQYTWKLRIFCFVLFPLCFVNSPTYDPDPYFDPRDPTVTYKEMYADGEGAWWQFIRHYVPYFLWQLAVALMAIEQGYYHYVMKSMPFGFSLTSITMFLGVTVLLLAYYTVWIVGFLVGFYVPGHTHRDEDGVVHNMWLGVTIMILYDVLTVVWPLILSVARVYGIGCNKAATWDITFSPPKKE